MQKIMLRIALATILGLAAGSAQAGPMIAFQGFETTPPADEWTFTTNYIPYNTEGDLSVTGNEDVFAPIEIFTTPSPDIIPSEGSQFWGMQDLENTIRNGGDHFIFFDDFDVSGNSDVKLSFDYLAVGFNTNVASLGPDTLSYVLTLDGSSGPEVNLVTGIVGGISTGGWQTEMIDIPDGTTDVGLTLIGFSDGSTAYAGWDNVQLSTAIPEPGSISLVGAAAFIGGITMLRRRRRQATKGRSRTTSTI